jgi:uncharacterized membrane protein YfcA
LHAAVLGSVGECGMDAASWAQLVLLGLAVGTFGTLIGAGGGFLLVPLLLLLYPSTPASTITAISLAVVFVNATSGSLAYARLGRIDYRTGIVFAAASAPGAILGSLATEWLERGTFDVVFGVALMSLAIYLLVWGKSPEGHARPEHVNLGLGAVLSFGVGFLSSVLGIGGGVIHVPLLIQFLGYPAHVATATSHFILAVMALVGTATHILNGDFVEGTRRTIALGAGVLAGAQVGAWLSQKVHGRWIMRSLAVGLLGVGGRLATHALIAGALAMLAATVQAARVDQTILSRHLLAMPSIGAGILGLLVGEAILLTLAWRSHRRL